MIYMFYMIHVMICLFLILVVLLQQGKGADLSVFGGGGTMTAFGARGAATLLHKMTVFGFIGFIVTTLVIGVLQKEGDSSSVMSDVPAVEETSTTQDDAEVEPVGAFAEDKSTEEIRPQADTPEDGATGDSSAAGAGSSGSEETDP